MNWLAVVVTNLIEHLLTNLFKFWDNLLFFQRQYTYSLDNSSLVNKAYKTLRDPYERGLYLLKLMDNAIEENETTGNYI